MIQMIVRRATVQVWTWGRRRPVRDAKSLRDPFAATACPAPGLGDSFRIRRPPPVISSGRPADVPEDIAPRSRSALVRRPVGEGTERAHLRAKGNHTG